jgi:phage-related protein
MSNLIYFDVLRGDKPIFWLHGEIKTPPFSSKARIEAGYLLRRLQLGEFLEMPQARPMPAIAPHCFELRIPDKTVTWRVIYFLDTNAIVILEVFTKKTQQTPRYVIEACDARLRAYKAARGEPR